MVIKKSKQWGIFFLSFCIICLSGAFISFPVLAAKSSVPKKLILSRKTITLYEGQMKHLSVKKAKPAGASGVVIWQSQNKKLAVVEKQGGWVTAKKAGRTQIIAISSKNSKIKATVKMIIKKAPQKKEKECGISGGVYKPAEGTMTRWWKGISGSYAIVQTEEDYQEMKSILKESFFLVHKDIDFTKESLIVCTVDGGKEDTLSLKRFYTKRGKRGKLTGVLEVDRIRPQGEGVAWGETCIHLAVFRINKKDAAMLNRVEVDNSYLRE